MSFDHETRRSQSLKNKNFKKFTFWIAREFLKKKIIINIISRLFDQKWGYNQPTPLHDKSVIGHCVCVCAILHTGKRIKPREMIYTKSENTKKQNVSCCCFKKKKKKLQRERHTTTLTVSSRLLGYWKMHEPWGRPIMVISLSLSIHRWKTTPTTPPKQPKKKSNNHRKATDTVLPSLSPLTTKS
jgi:hypothetical protein